MKIWANAQAIAETGGLDAHMARLLSRLAGSEDPLLALATRLVCRATSQGHICVSLADAAGQPLAALGEVEPGLAPPLPVWCEALRRHQVVGRPGDYAPLILDEAGRLYLYRYWAYQHELASGTLRPASPTIRRMWARGDCGTALDRLFPPAADGVDRQRLAAAVAALKRFSVISGGPGTGKTTTVVRILALLLEQARGPLRIALAAPTGQGGGEDAGGHPQPAGRRCRWMPAFAMPSPSRRRRFTGCWGFGRGRSPFGTIETIPCPWTSWSWTRPRWWTWRSWRSWSGPCRERRG